MYNYSYFIWVLNKTIRTMADVFDLELNDTNFSEDDDVIEIDDVSNIRSISINLFFIAAT